jgi:hypothetical protein
MLELFHFIELINPMNYETARAFITRVNLQLNNILSRDYFVESEVYDDSEIVLTYQVPTLYNLYEVLSSLEDLLEAIPLYHVIPTKATVMGEQCCAYSAPTYDFMYKVNCITDDSGLCDTIYVTLYDSLDALCDEVRSELDEFTTPNYEVISARPMIDVIEDFLRR